MNLLLTKPIELRTHWILGHPLGRLMLLCVAFIAMAAHLQTRLVMPRIQGWDYSHYLKTESTRALVPAPAPFAYRWVPHKLIPYVPLSPKRAHEFVNALAMCATAWIMTEWLVRLGFGARLAVPVVVLGFAWSMFGGAFFLWGRFATEPVAYLLVAGGIYLAHFGSLWHLVLVTAIATLSREQALLLVPYYYLVRRGSGKSPEGVGETLLLGVSALTCFIVVRAVTPTTGSFTYGHEIAQNLMTKFGSVYELATLVVCLITHGGLLPLVLLLVPGMSIAALRGNPGLLFWLVSNLGLAVIGGAETDRIAFFAFPAELFVLCAVLVRVGFAWTMEWIPAAMVFVLGQVALSGTFADGRFHPPNLTPIWCATSASIWATALLICSRRRLRADASRSSHAANCEGGYVPLSEGLATEPRRGLVGAGFLGGGER